MIIMGTDDDDDDDDPLVKNNYTGFWSVAIFSSFPVK